MRDRLYDYQGQAVHFLIALHARSDLPTTDTVVHSVRHALCTVRGTALNSNRNGHQRNKNRL